jgi:hypothetical protein
LFFQCNLPTEVWSTANPPIFTNNIPAEEEGIQMTINLLITNNPSESLLCKTLFTLWYIWKARNDNRFQRKTWTSFQVHQAANAHMQTHLSVIQEHQEQHDALTGPNAQGATTHVVGP